MFCDELKKRFAVLYNGKSCRPVLSSICWVLADCKTYSGNLLEKRQISRSRIEQVTAALVRCLN